MNKLIIRLKNITVVQNIFIAGVIVIKALRKQFYILFVFIFIIVSYFILSLQIQLYQPKESMNKSIAEEQKTDETNTEDNGLD